MSGCLFCEIVARERPAHILWESEDVIVFLALDGGPMVVPKPHIENLYELDDRHAAAVLQAATRVARALKAGLGCEGVNLVQSNEAAAGQDVFHFHLHVRPRWRGDDVVLAWDTRTIADERKVEIASQLKPYLTATR